MDATKQRIVDAIDSLRPLVQDIAVSLYEHPEIGLTEAFASQKLIGILRDAGFSVNTGTGGLPTAFLARTGTGRPSIAFMAEYDALPVIGHGCGHNLMGATAVAAGIAMSRVCPGTGWIVLGTPAEETIGGKVTMADAGVFKDIDAALIAHPGQRNSVGGGVHWASHPLEITFHGRSSHAGGNPQEGINALDACVAAYTAIRSLRNQLRDPVRLAGIISHGGDAQNVVPDRAQLKFTLRSTDWKYLEEVVIPRVKRCAEGAAATYGVTVEFRHHESLFRDTLDYPVLMDLCKANFELVGEQLPAPLPLAGGGVTDVGNVTWVTPSIQIGYRATTARGHSREMADSTVTPEGISAALTAVKVVCLTAYDLVADPKHLERARAHLNASLNGQRTPF
ncbi:MAG: amidohydrolase [Bacillota bacterium]